MSLHNLYDVVIAPENPSLQVKPDLFSPRASRSASTVACSPLNMIAFSTGLPIARSERLNNKRTLTARYPIYVVYAGNPRRHEVLIGAHEAPITHLAWLQDPTRLPYLAAVDSSGVARVYSTPRATNDWEVVRRYSLGCPARAMLWLGDRAAAVREGVLGPILGKGELGLVAVLANGRVQLMHWRLESAGPVAMQTTSVSVAALGGVPMACLDGVAKDAQISALGTTIGMAQIVGTLNGELVIGCIGSPPALRIFMYAVKASPTETILP